MTIDVWMQHPTQRFLRQPAFESLRRWTGQQIPDEEIPIQATLAAMDAAEISFGLLSARPIPYIDQVALDFPELVIVGGHIGYPWTEEMVAVARKHENVYIDTSAYTSKRYPPELVRYMTSRSGRRKVMFGSNYPMIPP